MTMDKIVERARQAAAAAALIGIVASLLLVGKPANACTCVYLAKQGQLVAGQNLDWFIDDGLLVINKRNVKKRGAWGEHPAEWTAKYASITPNFAGVGFPSRGMNEAGLVIGSMWLGETKYPDRDDRPSISGDQWIQYILDTCATVAEVLASNVSVRIDDDYPSHYLVSDASGECAVLEWFDGKLRVHRGDEVKVKVAVNSPYADCLAQGDDRTKRFAKVSRLLDNYRGGDPVEYMFSILEATRHKTTRWSLVFDVRTLRVIYTTERNPARRSVSLKDFDLSCNTPAQILDINAPGAGDMRRRFQPYTYEENARIARVMLRKWAAANNPLSETDLATILNYHATMQCLTNGPAPVSLRFIGVRQ
jgi:penicillin V acylase-like amidase (Ntn superfamily)